MNKKQSMIALCVVLITTSVFAFDKPTQLAKQFFGFAVNAQKTEEQNQKTSAPKNKPIKTIRHNREQSQNAEVPEYVLYEQTFRLIVTFRKKAEEQKAMSEEVTPLADYFQNEAKLNDEQTSQLQDIASKFVEELAVIDAQAKVIIENIRARIPKGQPTIDKKLLEPPDELKALQKKREELALNYRDRLRDLFGEEQFQKFGNFMQQKMASSIKAIPVSSDSLRSADEFNPQTDRRIEK